MLEGIRKLAWPVVELRLWQEWDEGDMPSVARRVREAGVTVNSVHLPPESERLLSTPGCGEAVQSLMDECLSAALEAGARVAVVHAWDLRLSQFSQSVMTENLCRYFEAYSRSGVSLSVEAIPGHSALLPEVLRGCPGVAVTLDTQWACLENSWRLFEQQKTRVNNVHVQTRVEIGGDGDVTLGRTNMGPGFDAESVVKGIAAGGYAGPVTLEPTGVPAIGETEIRRALHKLDAWLQEIPVPAANMSETTRRAEAGSG
ncbi:MAG: sugar phosphate isomerase/epimerase family protein [Bacillota bacterium]